jgi:hypothetical protein
MNRTTLIVAVSIYFLCVGTSLADADVSGKWELTISSPRGERSTSAEFIQDGEELTVMMQGREGNTIEAKGSVKGIDIEWTVRRETPRGTFEMVYKGKIEGDAMKGSVQFGSRGSGEWSAKRAE